MALCLLVTISPHSSRWGEWNSLIPKFQYSYVRSPDLADHSSPQSSPHFLYSDWLWDPLVVDTHRRAPSTYVWVNLYGLVFFQIQKTKRLWQLKERRDVLSQRWGKSESPFYLEILIYWSPKKIPFLPLEYVGLGWHHMCSLMMGCYEKISWTRWSRNNGVVTSGSRGQQAQDQVPAGLMSAEDWFLVHTW